MTEIEAKIEELKSRLKVLIESRWISQMSDDFYYTNGRYQRDTDEIIAVEREIEKLQKSLDEE